MEVFPRQNISCSMHRTFGLVSLCFLFYFRTIEMIFADSSKVIQLLIPQRKAVNIVVYALSLSHFIRLTPLK